MVQEPETLEQEPETLEQEPENQVPAAGKLALHVIFNCHRLKACTMGNKIFLTNECNSSVAAYLGHGL